jgi:sugar lactone lactonase YvrE
VGVAVDARTGNLYISDLGNNRVLEYDSALAGGDTTADRAFGQTTMLINTANMGKSAPDETTLNGPALLTVDDSANLYINDALNDRLLEYDTPIAPKQRIYLPLVRR